MVRSTVRSGPAKTDVLVSLLWLCLSAFLLVIEGRAYLHGGLSRSAVVSLSAVAGFVLTAVGILTGRSFGRWLGCAFGSLLCLYACALVLMGSEDAGGLGVTVPAGILLAVFGGWNVMRAIRSSAAGA